MKKCILLILIILLCGCSAHEVESSDIDMSLSDKTAKMQKEETLWAVLDNNEDTIGYLAEDDINVLQIKDLIGMHCDYVDNRSIDNLPVEKEMQLYTDEFRASLEKSGYVENVKEMYRENGLVLEEKQVIWYPNTFDEGLQYGKVTVDAEFILTEGEESYLKQREMSIDTIYIEQRVYYLEKIEENWKISNITKSALDKYDPT